VLVVVLAACGDGSSERPVTFGGNRPVDIDAPLKLTDGTPTTSRTSAA
jgi:hypothetical protein